MPGLLPESRSTPAGRWATVGAMRDLHLTLAGVSFVVELPDNDEVSTRHRYASYETAPTAEALRLSVRVAPEVSFTQPASMPYPGVVCTETPAGALVFDRRDLRLTWHRSERRAELLLAPPLDPPPANPSDRPPSFENALRILLSSELIRRGGLLIHASGAGGRRAVVFPAISGGGKTTTTRKLEPDEVLSDDQVALVGTGSGWEAHALPFVGLYGRPTLRQSAPLAAIAFLAKSPEPSLAPLSPAKGLTRLLGCVVSHVPEESAAAITLAQALVEEVPAWALALDLETPVAPFLTRLRG